MATRRKAKQPEEKQIIITRPKIKIATVRLNGTAPYVSNGANAVDLIKTLTRPEEEVKAMRAAKKRQARNFTIPYETSKHIAVTEGSPPKPVKKPWCGIPCTAFRWALIDACRLCDIEMTRAKMLVFVEADGWDDQGAGLVKILGGLPESFNAIVRCPPGPTGAPNVATRARWPKWHVNLRVRYDAELLKDESVGNLIERAGVSCGVGAGRPFSKTSPGMGWGTWAPQQSGMLKAVA